MSANKRERRGERFWSNSSFMFGEGSKFALAFSSEREASLDILFCQIREISQNFFLTHPAGEIFQHIGDRHSGSADCRFPAAFARLDRDDLAIIHVRIITKRVHLAR